MAQFETVLETVQLVLSQSSPAEIQTLINSLVKAQIVSEGYAKSLNLHQLHRTHKPGWDWSHSQGSTTNWLFHQGQPNQGRKYRSSRWGGSAEMDHNQRLESWFVDETDWSESRLELLCNRTLYPAQHGSYGELTELLRNEDRLVEGTSSEEKEWLQQVEQAARRIAMPLWQHWDRGQSMLLPLVPHTTTDSEREYLDMNLEEETELAVACRTLGFYGDESFGTETEFTKSLEGLCFPSHQHVGVHNDYLAISQTLGSASAIINELDDALVQPFITDDLPYSTAETLNKNLSLTSEAAHDAENVYQTPECTKMCSSDGKKDSDENKINKDLPDLHLGKFPHVTSRLLLLSVLYLTLLFGVFFNMTDVLHLHPQV